MTPSPQATVLTCVYNGEQYLAQAIESVLGQSFTDFEYIVVDDGSTDGSHAVAASYAAADDRIVILRNDTNRGISEAVNRGIAAARGNSVMILDHDDIAHPQRLALQWDVLAANSDVGVVGAHLEMVDPQSVVAGMYRPPATPFRLRWEMLFRCAIPMGAGCFRRRLLLQLGGLSRSFTISGDYELLTRVALQAQPAVVPQALLRYRAHPGQNTRVRAGQTHWEALIAAARWWRKWLGVQVALGDVGLVYSAVNGGRLATRAETARACDLILELQRRALQRESIAQADRDYLAANVAAKLDALTATDAG